jgi:hypothetical protein
MNSIRNSLGMPETEIARGPDRLWNPHFYAISPKFITRSRRGILRTSHKRNSAKFAVASSPAWAGPWRIGTGLRGVSAHNRKHAGHNRGVELLRAVATCYCLDFREFLP